MEDAAVVRDKIPVSIQDELRTSYLDYAMSVIIGRAIPDVRDGLKPVHRRILFSMSEQKIGPSGAHKKCARVVGDVLGKYHPHGDASVYDALVRMAQTFSLRYPLIDGQGNFGSVDGDSPAAMRYTESRLSRMSNELLGDIDKETVDFTPNYDDTEQEPTVLPAKFPQLLVNGSGGIAVGMATNIPPHNLGEVIDATVALIKNPEIAIEDLMFLIPGPDFPTGGLIYGKSGIDQAYRTGRGSICMRGKSSVEKAGKGEREQLVITEIPYQVNKARLVQKIAECMREKRIEGISEVRDESDREGMRVVVELKKDVFPQVILNQLFRLTDLQTTFGVINLSVANGRPAVLNLKETLEHFVEHRREVVTRRSRFELRQAEAQLELVEGLGVATDDIELIIKTIRASKDAEEARPALMALELTGLGELLKRAGRPETEVADAIKGGPYHLSERQARAILDMRLARLTGLERDKLAKEYAELRVEIDRLRNILASPELLMSVIIMELEDIKSRFNDPRRTEIVAAEAEIVMEDLIQEEDMVVTISHEGYVKRNPVALYRAQRRGGRGKIGATTRDEDFVEYLFVASTHSYLLCFTTAGKVYWLKVHEVPQAGRAARGRSIANLLRLRPEEKLSAFLPVREFREGRYVVFATRRGLIKKTDLMAYSTPRPSGIIAIALEDEDEVVGVRLTEGSQEIILSTVEGQAIRFEETEARPMGRDTYGVRGMKLDEGDAVVALDLVEEGGTLLAVSENGYGKRSAMDEYRRTHRGGKGIITMKTTDKTGRVIGVRMVTDADQIMLVTNGGKVIRMQVNEIRVIGRNTQGVRLIGMEPGERVAAVARLAERDDEADDTGSVDVSSAETDTPGSSDPTSEG
jgi:DNA gyrase subunit A